MLQALVGRLAETLIASHAGKAQAADLDTLFQLQIAAARYGEAETTLERLERQYRAEQSRLAYSLLPWRIYARAKRYEAGNGTSRQAALSRAFAELYGGLGDKEAAEIFGWYNSDLGGRRQILAAARQACPGADIQACSNALDLLKAYQALKAWEFLLPEYGSLLRADARRRFVVEDDLLIPMADGTKIATMIIRPRTPQRLTALLDFTIYAEDERLFARTIKMAAYGYAGVAAYSRGKGRSPGSPVPYEYDGRDAAAVIDWLAERPWSDGRVGMFSGSYEAFTQWAAAKHMPKALKALATSASNAPGIDTPTERNIFLNFFYPWPFYTTTIKGLNEKLYNDPPRWAALNRNWYLSGRPYRDMEKIDGLPNPVWAKWLNHPSYDAYWQKMLPFREEFRKIQIPVFVQTGYFDGGMVGALYYLRQHYKYNPEADHRLLIGPYHHFAMGRGVLDHISGYDIDQAARIDVQDIRLKWFDHVFRGAPLPPLLSDKVNFQVMGANRWRHVSSLDAMGNSTMRLYLSDARDGERLALSDTKPAKAGATELKVDFKDRSDADYQAPFQILSHQIDTRNALIFATRPLNEPLEVNGSFVGKLNIVTNKKDLDLSISLYEQLPDGRYFPLVTFIGRASYLGDRSSRHLLQPGWPQTLAFESDRISSRQISAGSRIVATVGVLKRPEFQINYGTGKDVSDESIVDAGEPLSISWANDSFLELRVWR